MNKEITSSWKTFLNQKFQEDYFKTIEAFVLQQEKAGKTIFPPQDLIFKAFNSAHFEEVKVVILGQDPYHGYGQAEGLSFSVPVGQKIPPSLKNIFKELETDLGIAPSTNGHLISWARQGVLLLNAVLTVNAKSPASHKKAGWEVFTDAVIKQLSTEREHLVFLLWGNFAQQKETLIDQTKHLVLKAAHPSPFSAHKGFFGCRHFSKTNAYLNKHNTTPIDWNLNQIGKQASLF